MSLTRFLFFLVSSTFALQASAQTQAQTDSLFTDTYLRPNDIFKGNIRWNLASTDQFTYRINSGIFGFYGPQPRFILDGIPVDINFFGLQNINMLPLNVNNIRNVRHRFSPGIYHGSVAPAGAFSINTVRPDSGVSLTSSFYIGNETGDPGPYIFDSLKTTSNIDRWGPDAVVSLGYRKEEWYARGLWATRNHQPTDLILNQRLHLTASVLGTNQQYVNYKIETRTRSGLFETGYKNTNLSVRARALYGNARDYLFLQAYGREIPVSNAYRQLAFESTFTTGDWVFSSRYITHHKSIDKRYDLHTYIFDWDQITHTLSASAQLKSKKFNLKPGFIYKRFKTRAPGIVEPYNDLVTLYLDGAIQAGSRARIRYMGSLSYDENRWAKKFKVSIPTVFTEHWHTSPSFFYSEILPLQQHSFAYWTQRGYTFADELGIPLSPPFGSFTDKIAGAGLTNQIIFNESWKLKLKQQLIRHQSINIPWQQVKEYEFLDTLPGEFTATQEQGSRFHFLAGLTNRISDTFSHNLSVLLQQTISGSQRYRSYFKQVPEAKISYDLRYIPLDDLTIWLNAAYRSSVKWEEYKALEGIRYQLPSGIPIRSVSGNFHTVASSFTNIAAGVGKWFWDRRLQTQFSIQNLLNKELRYHTVGAELFTKFNMRISLHF